MKKYVFRGSDKSRTCGSRCAGDGARTKTMCCGLRNVGCERRSHSEVWFCGYSTNREAHYLPIAVATGNAQDWATDHSRIMQPEHPVLKLMIKRFEKLERTVWQAEPEGGVWDREVIGKTVSLSNSGCGCIAIDKGDAHDISKYNAG